MLNFHDVYDFLMILRKVYKKREKVSNLRYSPYQMLNSHQLLHKQKYDRLQKE